MSAFDLTSYYPAVPDSSSYAEACILSKDGGTYLIAMPYQPSRSLLVHVRNSANLFAQSSTIYSLDSNSWKLEDIDSNTFYFTVGDILYSSEKDTFQGWNSIENIGYISNQSSVSMTSYDSFASGSVLSSTGNAFDSMSVSSVFTQIVGLLPVCLAVLIVYIGLRKGIAFVKGILQNA